MVWRGSLVALSLVALMVGCQETVMTSDKATPVGTGSGTGMAPEASDGFGEVVGTGLVGGGAGYLGGDVLQGDDIFRDPRFGR